MVLLVAGRLQRRHELVGGPPPPQPPPQLLPQPSLLAVLPNELWHMVCSFFLRSDWLV